MRKLLATALGALLLLAPVLAGAEDPKRVLPDYDGRPPPSPTPEEVALWVPRLVLFPPYVVSEYVLRRPLGALVVTAERHNWAQTLVDFFTFGPDHKAGLVPTAFFDFGLQPSVGLYFFWNDALAKGNDLRAHASWFGTDWVAAAVSDRVHVGKKSRVAVTASWVRRPDNLYYGDGPRSLASSRSRYFADVADVYPSYEVYPMNGVRFDARVGVRNAAFEDRGFDGDPSVDQSVAAGLFARPASYGTGATVVYDRATLTLESRKTAAETGVRAGAYVEGGSDVRERPFSSWIKYGGTLGASLDVWNERVLSLVATVDFADPVNGGPIPFTEEVVWGGTEPLSGFLPGRLHGRSAAAASLVYAWPIWVWLDGTVHASVGNVFDAGLRDFDPSLLRLSSGIGIQSTGSPDHRFELLVGFGTETFAQGAQVDSLRLVFGGTNGF
jgi:hypothetical protein